MLLKLKKILSTETAKDTTIMTVATGVSAVVAAVFFIIVARTLGPELLGIFSLATAASFMFADIFDIALNTSLIRFVARELSRNLEKSEKYLKFVFKLKLKIAFALIVLIAILSKPLSQLLFGTSLPKILILIGFGTGFHLLLSFSVSHLQARRKFIKAAGGIILTPLLRLIGLFGLIASNSLHLMNALFVYFFTTPIAGLLTLFLAPRKFFKTTNENEIAKKYLKYNIPLTAGFALAAISGRVDNFILANLSDATAVGFYSAAFRLFTPLQFLAGSLATVFAPRFSSFTSNEQAKVYLKKTLAVVALLAAGLVMVYPLSPILINLFYGSEFIPSVAAFKILLFGFAVFVIQAPLTSTLLYYLSKPKIFGFLALFQLITLVTLDYLFIGLYGYQGAAWAFLITQIAMLSASSLYIYKKMRETDHNEHKS